MNVAAGPRLAAAVSNAGGCGVIGGVGYVSTESTSCSCEVMRGCWEPPRQLAFALYLHPLTT